jgi:mannose-1-phosphate guanylyltransferase
MVMAAGLGTRLRPITWEIPKPVVPVANRPIVAHLTKLLADHGVDEVIANLHWFPDVVKSSLGDGSKFGVELSYAYEEELLGTAGGVRNVADFLTGGDDDVFVVLAGDALTDIDLGALVAAHRENGGVATLAVKQVADVSQYGVIVTGSDGRVEGFQEKPDPAEALSNLCNCMIYAFSPEVFDYFPEADPVDFANDVFPALLDNDVPFHVHEIETYWNDIGTLPEYINGNLDVLTGAV